MNLGPLLLALVVSLGHCGAFLVPVRGARSGSMPEEAMELAGLGELEEERLAEMLNWYQMNLPRVMKLMSHRAAVGGGAGGEGAGGDQRLDDYQAEALDIMPSLGRGLWAKMEQKKGHSINDLRIMRRSGTPSLMESMRIMKRNKEPQSTKREKDRSKSALYGLRVMRRSDNPQARDTQGVLDSLRIMKKDSLGRDSLRIMRRTPRIRDSLRIMKKDPFGRDSLRIMKKEAQVPISINARNSDLSNQDFLRIVRSPIDSELMRIMKRSDLDLNHDEELEDSYPWLWNWQQLHPAYGPSSSKRSSVLSSSNLRIL